MANEIMCGRPRVCSVARAGGGGHATLVTTRDLLVQPPTHCPEMASMMSQGRRMPHDGPWSCCCAPGASRRAGITDNMSRPGRALCNPRRETEIEPYRYCHHTCLIWTCTRFRRGDSAVVQPIAALEAAPCNPTAHDGHRVAGGALASEQQHTRAAAGRRCRPLPTCCLSSRVASEDTRAAASATLPPSFFSPRGRGGVDERAAHAGAQDGVTHDHWPRSRLARRLPAPRLHR